MPGHNKPGTDASRIYSFAWDCTIGAGRVGEDFPDEPDQDVLRALSRVLKRPLTPADQAMLIDAWRRCEQEQANP